MKYDVAIIGSGPGGYVAALRARQLNLNVCLVERGDIGGVCLNRGCIPSKALIHQAELFASLPELRDQGVGIDISGWDFSLVSGKAAEAGSALSRGVNRLLKKAGVEVVQGDARLVAPRTILVDNETTIEAENIILATGSRPRSLPGIAFDGKAILSSDDALFLKKRPDRLLIVGGGAIGCEMASIFASFGTEVVLCELMDSLLPQQERETAGLLARDFHGKGITVMTSTVLKELEHRESGIRVQLIDAANDKKVDETNNENGLVVDSVIIAAGRIPNTENIGLEDLGVRTDRGYIPVNNRCRTNIPGVYAVGDIVTTPQLAHVASREGEIAAEDIAGRTELPPVDESCVPYAVYTIPEIAGFGSTEESLNAQGREFSVGRFPYRGIGRAVAQHKSTGLVKVLTEKTTGEILGAHIFGHQASEMIHELLLARSSELVSEDIIRLIHAHPAFSEGLREAVLASGQGALHK